MTTETSHILVAGGEDASRDYVVSVLQSAGFEPRPASSPIEAIALLHSSGPFDLVLCDLAGPSRDCLSLLSDSQRHWPDLPAVIVATAAEYTKFLEVVPEGAYQYVLKPFQRIQLLATVQAALRERSRVAATQEYQRNLELLVTTRSHDLRSAQSELGKAQEVMLEALGAALDLRDAETQGHSLRVTAFSVILARSMRLPEDLVQTIAHGALLHDIGKIAIPDAILYKTGRLTAGETAVVRQHCYDAYQIMKRVPFLQEAAELVYAHHEWYDGSGYPRGLKGDAIPLGARIFAVADTIDAITSDRPYRPALPMTAARNEIARWSGRQFDSRIVDVFLSLPENVWSVPDVTDAGHGELAFVRAELGA